MASHGSDDPLKRLQSLVETSIKLACLLEPQLYAVATGKAEPTSTTPPPSESSSAQPIDALALAHDAASLIKAHSTKLSLLIINEPFTPSAICKVLQELVAGPLPGLSTAVQLCDAKKYTTVAREDLAWRCYRVVKDLKGLLEIIPRDGKILPPNKKNGAKGDKGSLASTGVIWAACDDVILLKKLGTAGLLVKKVEEYRDTLKDVLEELKEWKEEGEEEQDEDDNKDEVEYVTDHLEATHVSAQDMIDDLMNPQHIPKDDPDKIKERLDWCLKRLRMTTLLYTAVVKRRLKVLPSFSAQASGTVVKRLDEVFPILRRIPTQFNELACAFYDLEPDAIDRTMDACFFDAFAASEMLMKPWDDQKDKDEFTEWAEKFQVSIKQPE